MKNKKQTAQRRAFLKYRSNKCKSYTIVFNKEYDAELINIIENAENKTDLVRKCIKYCDRHNVGYTHNTYVSPSHKKFIEKGGK